MVRWSEWPLAPLHVLTQSCQWEAIQPASNQTVPISFRWIWNQETWNPTTTIPITRSRSCHGERAGEIILFLTLSVLKGGVHCPRNPIQIWTLHQPSQKIEDTKLNQYQAWWPASADIAVPCTQLAGNMNRIDLTLIRISYDIFKLKFSFYSKHPWGFIASSSVLTNLLDFTPHHSPPPRVQTGKSKQSLISSKHFPLLR